MYKTLLILCLFIYLSNGKTIMPWFCLERCHNGSDDSIALSRLLKQRDLYNPVSFEMFNIVAPGNLSLNTNLTLIVDKLVDKFETFAMISAEPHHEIQFMRNVFDNPSGFIDEAIKQAKIHKFNGYNVDFEPDRDVTKEDGERYPIFLQQFSTELHKHGLKVNVDVTTWSPLWNWTAISLTDIDQIVIMRTYRTNFTRFYNAFMKAIHEVPDRNKIVIGLMPDTPHIYSYHELKIRFDMIKEYNIQHIALWNALSLEDSSSIVPESWLPFLHDFLEDNSSNDLSLYLISAILGIIIILFTIPLLMYIISRSNMKNENNNLE